MKKLLIALAAAATAVVASAEITNQLDFEGADGTAYANDAPSVAANYPFASFGDKYLELEESYKPDVNSGNILDMYAEFVACDEACGLEEGEKLGVYVDKTDGCLVVVGRDVTKISNVDTEGWHRLTVVPSGTADFYVYVDGQKVQNEPFAGAGEDNSISEMEFKGSGKLDNFVARTTNPFGGEPPTGWIANIGTDDPEKYFTDYTKALEKALAGAKLTFADENVQMDGTAEHPFEIRSVADLVALQQAVATTPAARAYNYRQTADIDMTGADAFAGIGVYNANPTAGTPFTGTYDGGNHKISNVTMTARNYGGIFNQVNGGTIKNLTVENISTAATSGEFGYAIVGNAGNGATLENLTAAGSFLSSEKPGTHNMAGIVVRACGGGENGTLIKNCTNSATVYGAYTKLGGICAIAQYKVGSTPVTFQNCSNTGALDISYVNEKNDATGFAGILAYSADDAVLEGCSNTGTLTNSGETENDNVKGALVGTVQTQKLTLKSAIASGDIGMFNAGCTVALDYDVSGNGVDFNLYGATGTTVELLQDFTGYPQQNAVINPTLKLSANMTINDGWQNITNATFTAISGAGTLTASHTYDYVKFYRIKKLDGFTGTLASGQPRVYFVIDDIVAAETPAYGAAVVKGGSSLKVYDLASTTLGGVVADLCVDTLDNQNGIYLVAAQVVADDKSTTGYASVANALAAADAAYASTVNVLDTNAEEVAATGWSYANGVYTSTREVATLNDTSYPSLAKALAAAQDGDTVTLVATSSEAVTIPAGVTVAVADNVAFNGTVAGAGTVKYTAAQTGTIKFGEWTGTVTLDWAGIVNANDIAPVVSKYGKAGSTVEIGPNGTITGDSYFNSNPVVTLKVSGFVSINNGSSGAAGKRTIPTVTGDGVLVFGTKGAMVNYAIDNVVDWNGVITNSASATLITNLVSGSGTVVYKAAAAAMKIGDEFDGEVEYAVMPAAAPVVGANSEATVYLNFNYAGMNIAPYGKANSTIKLGNLTAVNAYFNDGSGDGTGLISSKVVVAGGVTINNAWPLGSADWTSTKVVRFGNRLKVDGSLTFASTRSSWTGYGYYRADILDASGVGSITVGNRFALRIDAVDFAEAPSGKNALVKLTLTGDTAGLLYGPNGVVGEQIPVTVNGEATEQTLVYDAVKGGLVLYVAPIAFIYDENGNLLQEIPAGDNDVMQAAMAFLQMEIGESIKFASSIENTEFHAMFLAGCTYDATTFTYTRKHEAAVAKITVGQKDYTFPTLAAAIEAAHDGETVVLLDDIAVTEMQCISGKAVTLDLAGFAITAGERSAEAAAAQDDAILCVLHGGSLTINDSSADGTGAITGNSVFTTGVKMTKKGDTDDTKKAVLVVNGGTITGYYYGIAGNGLAGRGNTEVTINGGSVYGTCVNDCVAIFQPQLGTLTINGGYFEGAMGVYVKSGTATVAINGGTIKGNGTYAAYVHSKNGFNNTGDAFVVDNAGYPGGAPAPSILGGTFVSVNASAIASYAKTGLERIVHFADKDAVTITEAKASAEDVFLVKGFPGGADGKTFNIDTAVQAALAEKIPAGKALTDAVEGTTSGVTYAQAYALGLLDEETGDVAKDVTSTIEIVDGKVVVSLDATAKAGYTVMLNVYEKASLTAKWNDEPTKRYKLGSEEEFSLSEGGSGFYKVGVTIEDAASGN